MGWKCWIAKKTKSVELLNQLSHKAPGKTGDAVSEGWYQLCSLRRAHGKEEKPGLVGTWDRGMGFDEALPVTEMAKA